MKKQTKKITKERFILSGLFVFFLSLFNLVYFLIINNAFFTLINLIGLFLSIGLIILGNSKEMK